MATGIGLDRLAVATALRRIAALLAVEGGPAYRRRAFERGARSIERFAGDFEALVREGRLRELPSIGPVLERIVGELAASGSCKMLEDLERRLPAGAAELSSVLSLPRMRALGAALGIRSLAELEEACAKGRVRGVAGFGEKSERKLLDDVRALTERGRALLLPEADATLRHAVEYARSRPEILSAHAAGTQRRRHEASDRLSLVLEARAPEAALDAFAAFPPAVEALEREPGALTLLLAQGCPLEVRAVGPEDLGLALVFATGAPEHVALLVARAGARGVKLSPAASEEDVYARLGLPFIPPELRDGTDELELAERGALPRLVTRDDLMGAVHCHTTYSDGVASVEAMAQGAEALGLRYITITDHSPAAYYANGLDAARLRQQWAEMARVQRGVGVKLLRGVECDILKDGSLDCAPELVEELDVVIASIHQRFKLDRAGMTRRVVTAMRQAPFKIWGHGLGRYVLSRPPIDCDVPAVLDAIAESRAAIELNGDPHRLDLEPRWVREAKKRGIAFVVSSDAHSVNGLRNADYGVDMARRAGLEADDVLNARPPRGFRSAVRP
jgi:DNA polymerase (family 10)